MDQSQDVKWYQPDAEYAFDDPDFSFNDAGDLDQDGEGGESRDAKRRRIARACDMCRKKKIKCDGKMPKCSHCQNYHTECIFTQIEKKRAPPKGAKYIEGLENRLGRMEALLRLSGLLTDDDAGRTDLGTLEKRLAERQGSTPADHAPPATSDDLSPDAAVPTPQDHLPSPSNPPAGRSTPKPREPDAPATNVTAPANKDVDALADQMCSLVTNSLGETRYIGSSSGFSIFSPKGVQWVNEKTGDTSFQQTIAQTAAEDKHSWDHWKPEVFNDLFTRPVFKPLPSKQECCALLRDYFEHFNQMFPLFHEPTFMHLVDRHYSNEPFEGSGWWASLNVALAIAHRLRVMSNVVGREEDDHAWGYLKNALGVMSELTIRNNDLLSVQALLGMALFLQGTPNPQPSFFLTAAAIRLSHSIGLHKRGKGFNLNEAENEQRKRVFWIAYMVDKDICLRSGRPPTQDDDDMNVELPSENPPDNIGSIPLSKEEPDGRKTMNLFRLMCTFAQIQSRVYKRLYSVKASHQSDGELLNTIGELDAELEEWKDSIPADFRPDNEIKAAHTPLILHVVVLQFAYYNCLTTIHRMSVHHGYWTSRLSDYAFKGLNTKSLNPRVYSSAALCVSAARSSIGLIRYIPQGDYACVWMVLYYPVSALVTLFANILQNPQDPRARSDLKLMSSVVSFLTMLERDVTEASGNIQRMLSVCAEFERIAGVVLEKSARESRARGKRKAAGGMPQTDREREKAVRERGLADVTLERELAEGKTLEQMQVEAQNHYRRPVQTPSLRASVGGGSQASGQSPASWAGSPVAADIHSPTNPPNADTQFLQPRQQQPPPMQQQPQSPNGAGHWATTAPPPFPMSAASPGFAAGGLPTLNTQYMDQMHGGQNIFGQESMANGFSSPNGQMPGPNVNGMNGYPDPANSAGVPPTPSFQQPFVPQDLWQMPMTLEWDWAEGLGLGSFTSGQAGMYDQQPHYGYSDGQDPTTAAPGQ